MTEILLQNGLRSGAMAAITTSHVENANYIASTDCFCISIVDHKTLATLGPCVVSLSKRLHSDISLYCEKFRKILLKNSKYPSESIPQSLFLLANGKAMTTNHTSLAVRSAWVACGLNSQLTVSLFRKSIVTRVHQKSPLMAGRLAKLLAHRLTTATSYYSLFQNERDSTETSVDMQAVMENKLQAGRSQVKLLADKEVQTDIELHQRFCDNCQSIMKSAQPKTINEEDGLKKPMPPMKAHGRRTFSLEDVQQIKILFHDFIATKRISTAELRQRLEGNAVGQDLASRYTINQLRDRIRTFFR